MDFVRSYFSTNEALTSWTLFSSLFFHISANFKFVTFVHSANTFLENNMPMLNKSSTRSIIFGFSRCLKRIFKLMWQLLSTSAPAQSYKLFQKLCKISVCTANQRWLETVQTCYLRSGIFVKYFLSFPQKIEKTEKNQVFTFEW